MVSIILRIGLAFTFLYPPIAAFFDPLAWIGYFPQIAHDLIPDNLVLLHMFGIFEIGLALWILSGRGLFYAGLLASFILVAIVIFNYPQIDVLFRDLSIAAMALALAFLHFNPRSDLNGAKV